MSDNNGIGLLGLLGIAFIVLKLCGVISWPWVWVLAPFWIGLALVLLLLIAIPAVIIAFVAIFAAVGWVIKRIADHHSK